MSHLGFLGKMATGYDMLCTGHYLKHQGFLVTLQPRQSLLVEVPTHGDVVTIGLQAGTEDNMKSQ